jgi:hypothetical protein
MEDSEEPEREPTNTFSSVLRPGSMTMKNAPPAVLFQLVTSPERSAEVSTEVIAFVRVHAGAAPAYDLLAAYGIYTPSLVLNAL